MQTWQNLAVQPPWTAAQLHGLAGQCRGALVQDWATLAGPVAATRTRACLLADGFASPDVAAAAWLPIATHLRLHDVLAESLCAGDRVAFGQLWLQQVAARVPRPAHWLARQVGLARSTAWLLQQWPELWQVPPPRCEVTDGRLTARFAGHPVFGQPTWRWLTALQAHLLLPLVVGRPLTVVADGDDATFSLRV